MRYAGIRLGEADHPGPVISMPGDGKSMFHALAYWAKQDQNAVRHTVAKHGVEHLDQLFPWDTSEEYADFLHTALTPGAWGAGSHLAIASQVYTVRIAVVGDRPCWFGNEGAVWTIRFDGRLEHYDVVVESVERRRPSLEEVLSVGETRPYRTPHRSKRQRKADCTERRTKAHKRGRRDNGHTLGPQAHTW